MKLTTQKDTTLDDDYVNIRYRELTPTIHQLIQLCENKATLLLCETHDGVSQPVDIQDIYYIEWVERKSYVYTKTAIYTLALSLTQLEKNLPNSSFVRISRMALVNVYKINTLTNGLNFRLTAELFNGERLIINRSYRGALLSAISELAGRFKHE